MFMLPENFVVSVLPNFVIAIKFSYRCLHQSPYSACYFSYMMGGFFYFYLINFAKYVFDLRFISYSCTNHKKCPLLVKLL